GPGGLRQVGRALQGASPGRGEPRRRGPRGRTGGEDEAGQAQVRAPQLSRPHGQSDGDGEERFLPAGTRCSSGRRFLPPADRDGGGRVFSDKRFLGHVRAAVKAHQILLSLLLHVVDTVYVDVIFVQFEERHRVAPISFGWQFSTLRIRDRKWYRLIFSSRW